MMKLEYVWKPSVGDKQGNCGQCRLYCAVALGVLDELQDIQHHIHGMEVSLAAKKELRCDVHPVSIRYLNTL